MGKQERIKKLTWKYFWEQKTKELLNIVLWAVGIIVVPLGLGLLIIKIFNEPTPNIFILWSIGALFSLFLFFVGAFIYMIIRDMIIKWIKSNWVKARTRATKEVYKKSKGGIK